MLKTVLTPALCALTLAAAPSPRDGGPGTPPEGLTIKNARYVGDSKKIIRGHAPNDQVSEFKAAGISHVLIIKNQSAKEVDKEIDALITLGYKEENILHIPYRWKDVDPSVACEQTVAALNHMHAVEATPKAKLYFHCTAGIDRTGLVSALFRLQKEPASQVHTMFTDEMCARGYGDGHNFRPRHVQETIHRELTPIYIKLAHHIVKNRKSGAELTADFCRPEIFQNPKLDEKVAGQLERFKCRKK